MGDTGGQLIRASIRSTIQMASAVLRDSG